MVNYQNGKIYKIVCNVSGLIYIGSTTKKTLAMRLSGHRSAYKAYLDKLERAAYITSFQVLEKEDYSIILIENYPCNNKDELRARERFYIESINCVNKAIPGRGKLESRMVCHYNNKEKNNKQALDYYYKNKDKLNEILLCECGKSYTKGHKNRHEKTKFHQANKH